MVGLDALRQKKKKQFKREQQDVPRTESDDGIYYSNIMALVRTESWLHALLFRHYSLNIEYTFWMCVALFLVLDGQG